MKMNFLEKTGFHFFTRDKGNKIWANYEKTVLQRDRWSDLSSWDPAGKVGPNILT